MIQNVHRFYDATPEFYGNAISGLSTANILALPTYPTILKFPVNTTKNFHKIWSIVYNDLQVANVLIDCDLVGTILGREVYRQKIIRQNNSSWQTDVTNFGSCIRYAQNISAGAQCESISLVIGSAPTSFELFPILLNVAVDTWRIDIANITGNPNQWVAILFIRSEAGI